VSRIALSRIARTGGTGVVWLLLVVGCRAPILTVDDAVAFPGQLTRLAACVEREPILGLCHDIKQVPVAFDVNNSEVGSAKTGREGVAEVEHKLQPGTREYDARVLVDGRELHMSGRVYTWDQDRVIIAVDIDHTIAQTDYKGLLRSAESEDTSSPVEHSAETLSTLSQDFQIVYLTGRPRFMIDKTRTWLRQNGFPAGPVITSVRVRDLANPGAFKRQKLRELRAAWPKLLIGIGNQISDAGAYGVSGMLALVVPPKPGRVFDPHTLVFGDWEDVGRFFEVNLPTLTDAGALQDVIAGKQMLMRTLAAYGQR
jgi:hypothetical protein